METLSDRLNAALDLKKTTRGWMSKRALARAVGLSAPSVHQWFTGQTQTIQYQHLLTTADFLGVNPHWLATGEGEMLDGVTPKDSDVGNDAENVRSATRKEYHATNDEFNNQVELLLNNEIDKNLITKLKEANAALSFLHSILSTLSQQTRKDIAHFVYLLLVENDKEEIKTLTHLIIKCLHMIYTKDKTEELVQSSKHKEAILNTLKGISQ